MKDNDNIYNLKRFIRHYDELHAQNPYSPYVNMTIDVWQRDATEDALNLLIEDYNIRTDEKRFPENIFSILGFDISRGLTGSQMQGFGYILSNNLTEKETELIMAKYRDGKEDKEIAAEQGISPQLVSQKLHDIVRKLKQTELLEKLAGGKVEIDSSGNFTNEYTIIRNRRLKAINELQDDVKRLETALSTIRENWDKLGLEACKELADNTVSNTLRIKIDDVPFSARAFTILSRAEIRYMSDLMDWDYESLMKLRNCGKGIADEIVKKAAEYGIIIRKNSD